MYQQKGQTIPLKPNNNMRVYTTSTAATHFDLWHTFQKALTIIEALSSGAYDGKHTKPVNDDITREEIKAARRFLGSADWQIIPYYREVPNKEENGKEDTEWSRNRH